MLAFLSNFLQKKGIDCFSPVPLSACRVEKPYLLERHGIKDGTAVMLAIPYYTPHCDRADRNISAYATSRDYHLFFKELYDELLPLLKERFPSNRFAAFADHSPISEVHAASIAGLGVIGRNHMLLTGKYSSYVFLGEIVTDAILPAALHEVRECCGCGLCMKACPAEELGICLSALTQKKGDLTPTEREAIKRFGSAWGCDICQKVCPHTKKAMADGTIYSPIEFFSVAALPHPTHREIADMSDPDFAERAFSWRGRNTVLRNLSILEDGEKGGDRPC